MLTPRAQQYLSTLKRRAWVPTTDVKRLLEEGGHPCFDLWLDFHERYAGYAHAGVTLGITQPVDGEWPALSINARCDNWGQVCSVRMGDTLEHCRLSSTGRVSWGGIVMGEAESFEKMLERNALSWAHEQSGKWDYLDDDMIPHALEALEEHWIPEASDKYYDAYANNEYLAFIETHSRRVVDVFRNFDHKGLWGFPPGRRKPATPRQPGSPCRFLPMRVEDQSVLSDDPYTRLVERLSMLGNLPSWSPRLISEALGAELISTAGDPSDPERRYFVENTDTFKKVTVRLPTHNGQFDWTINAYPHPLPPRDPNLALHPIHSFEHPVELACPKIQEDKSPKGHYREFTIGETAIYIVFEGEALDGPQRIIQVSIDRPIVYSEDDTRYEPNQYRVERSTNVLYEIKRIDDGSVTVEVVRIDENPDEPDRVQISFICLDPMLTLQEASRLITLLIVQGERRTRYLGRVEYMDYIDLESGLEYTRLWNQRGS